ncbi:MAG TPA: hypothetical protein VMQ62_06185 [Dongiaceae bacterium]|nr:hypothetical protein [Dongiaceae bacterium]
MMRLRWLVLFALSVVLPPGVVLAAYPGVNGKLLYIDRSGDPGVDLVVVDNDGRNATVLNGGLYQEITRASWSPDGSRIAFTGYPVGSPQQEGRLYVTDQAGGSIQEIDIAPARNAELPTWSPDGTRIAFSGLDDDSGGSEHAIFAIDLDGTGLVRISPPSEDFFYFSLAWSPRGDTLLFAGLSNPPCVQPPCSGSDADAEIYLLGVGTGVITRLTTNTVLEETASWSPDGGRIVFDRITQTDPSCRIIVMDLTTGQETDVSQNQSPKRCFSKPAWSPDGSLIAYVTSTTVNNTAMRVFLEGATGNGKKQVTDGPLDFWPDWQPLQP